MAWRQPGGKPLSEPMMARLPTHICVTCVTRPQWVNSCLLIRGPFKNAHELLNLRALKFSSVNKIHIFQCMSKISCVEFQRVSGLGMCHWYVWLDLNITFCPLTKQLEIAAKAVSRASAVPIASLWYILMEKLAFLTGRMGAGVSEGQHSYRIKGTQEYVERALEWF